MIGIKAYGKIYLFKSKGRFKAYLIEAILDCEGSARERYSLALANLESGITFTDTDERRITKNENAKTYILKGRADSDPV